MAVGNSSGFAKEIRVAFPDVLQGFEDALVQSRMVSVYNTDQTMMARANDTIWRPRPYTMRAFAGIDQTGNFNSVTQLTVPSRISRYYSANFSMDQLELRDALQSNRIQQACSRQLASVINQSVNTVTALESTLVVARTAAATGFDDLAQADAIMNDRGVPMMDRVACLSTRDYNSMGSNLAGRQTLTPKALTAYEKASIGMLAGFDTYKLDYAYSLAASTAATVSVTNANQFYVPAATSATASGELVNVDNRYQTINITVGSGILKAGDAFTITGVNAVHQESKQDTGQLMTFLVISGPAGGGTGDYVISPPIISAQGGTFAERQYQNVTATPAAGAVVNILNVDTAFANPFWHREAVEIIPGNIPKADDSIVVASATTEQGFTIQMSMFRDIDTNKYKVRCDTFWGVTMLQPEMAGILLFSQVP